MNDWIALGTFFIMVMGAIITLWKMPGETVKNMGDTIVTLSKTVHDLSADVVQFRTELNAMNAKEKTMSKTVVDLKASETIMNSTIDRLEKLVKDLITGIDILSVQLRDEAKSEPKWKRPNTAELKLKSREKNDRA